MHDEKIPRWLSVQLKTLVKARIQGMHGRLMTILPNGEFKTWNESLARVILKITWSRSHLDTSRPLRAPCAARPRSRRISLAFREICWALVMKQVYRSMPFNRFVCSNFLTSSLEKAPVTIVVDIHMLWRSVFLRRRCAGPIKHNPTAGPARMILRRWFRPVRR